MEKSKLIEVLKTFDSKQIRRFEEFCGSPFFNKNKTIVKLISEIRKAHPKFSSKAIEKEKIFKKIFPKEKYNDQRLRDLISTLYKLLELFISVRIVEDDSFFQKNNLLKKFQHSPLSKYFDATYREASDLLHKNKNDDYFYHKFNLELMMNDHIQNNKLITEEKVVAGANEFYYPYDSLTIWYLKKKLNLHFSEINNTKRPEKHTLKPFDENLTASLIARLGSQQEHIIPYFDLIKFQISKDEAAFRKLIAFAESDAIAVFSKEEQLVFFKVLVNHSIQRTFVQDPNALKDQHYLYKLIIKKGLHVNEGKMETNLFHNIVISFINANDTAHIYDFIEKNKSALDDFDRENAVNFALALATYTDRDFHSSLRYLNKIELNTVYTKINIRALQIKCFFELGEYESVLSSVDSLRHTLNEKEKYQESKREAYLKFFSHVKSLAGFALSLDKKNKKELSQFREKIIADPSMQQPWVMKHLDLLLEKI